MKNVECATKIICRIEPRELETLIFDPQGIWV